MRRWFEKVWHKGNAAIDELASEDFVLHHSGRPGQPIDLRTYKQFYPAMRAAFPDLRVTIEDLVAEGDAVAARLTESATHLGEYRSAPPTGKRLAWTGLILVRVRGGKLAEVWAEEDWRGLMEQIGAGPAPAPAAG